MIALRNSNILMKVDPGRGGGILEFSWQNRPIFLPVRANDPSPLGLASFPKRQTNTPFTVMVGW